MPGDANDLLLQKASMYCKIIPELQTQDSLGGLSYKLRIAGTNLLAIRNPILICWWQPL